MFNIYFNMPWHVFVPETMRNCLYCGTNLRLYQCSEITYRVTARDVITHSMPIDTNTKFTSAWQNCLAVQMYATLEP